jgi:hypothetical protein
MTVELADSVRALVQDALARLEQQPGLAAGILADAATKLHNEAYDTRRLTDVPPSDMGRIDRHWKAVRDRNARRRVGR